MFLSPLRLVLQAALPVNSSVAPWHSKHKTYIFCTIPLKPVVVFCYPKHPTEWFALLLEVCCSKIVFVRKFQNMVIYAIK